MFLVNCFQEYSILDHCILFKDSRILYRGIKKVLVEIETIVLLLYACKKYNYHIFGNGGKVPIMATHGAVGPFNVDREDWLLYIERLQQYFIANEVKEDRQRAILLSVCGAPTYQVIRNLAVPRKPTAFTFGELVEFVQSYYSSTPSTIVQHYNFNTRVQ